jgi:hypothetical protein
MFVFSETYHVWICDWRLDSRNVFPSVSLAKFATDDRTVSEPHVVLCGLHRNFKLCHMLPTWPCDRSEE